MLSCNKLGMRYLTFIDQSRKKLLTLNGFADPLISCHVPLGSADNRLRYPGILGE